MQDNFLTRGNLPLKIRVTEVSICCHGMREDSTAKNGACQPRGADSGAKNLGRWRQPTSHTHQKQRTIRIYLGSIYYH